MKKAINLVIISAICSLQLFTTNAQEKKWKLGVQMWTFHISSFERAVQRADSAGLKFVEVYPGQKLYESSTNYIDPGMSEEDCRAMQKMVKDKGISIGAFGVLLCETEAEWKLNFDFAKKMHIPVKVAKEFNQADKGTGILKAGRGRPRKPKR